MLGISSIPTKYYLYLSWALGVLSFFFLFYQLVTFDLVNFVKEHPVEAMFYTIAALTGIIIGEATGRRN